MDVAKLQRNKNNRNNRNISNNRKSNPFRSRVNNPVEISFRFAANARHMGRYANLSTPPRSLARWNAGRS